MLRTYKIVLGILLMVSVFSCRKEDATPPSVSTERTVLVYLGGDNSLSADLQNELQAFRQGWNNLGSNCIIYIDPSDGPPCLLQLKKNQDAYIDTLRVYAEHNSASPEVFRQIIEEVVSKFPAKSYGLFLASHATGWLPRYTLANFSIGSDFNGDGIDKQKGDEMDLADFAAAIPDKQFDFIVFDACFMAGLEVAYELRNKTSYILACSGEILAEGFTPIIAASQKYIFNTQLKLPDALISFAKDYYNYAMSNTGVRRSAALSVIKSTGIGQLAGWIKEQRFTWQKAITATSLQHFDRPGSYRESISMPKFFDLGNVMQVEAEASVYAGFEKQLAEAVIWKANTPYLFEGDNGVRIDTNSGLTIYLQRGESVSLDRQYENTTWYKFLHSTP